MVISYILATEDLFHLFGLKPTKGDPMLTEHEKFVEQVAASYAHEIKNPIAIIKAHLQLLELDDSNPAHKKSFFVAHKELDRINTLVYDLMNTFKPQCTKFSIIPISLPIHEITQLYEPVFDAKNILFSVNVEASCHIYADCHKLVQVLINILNNATEALSNTIEKKEITLRCFESNGSVVIQICDNGTGIEGNHLDKIGSAFFSTKESGNGLGLFLSKKIIDEHNGTLELKNNEEHGCIVCLSLPIFNTHYSTLGSTS